MAVSLRGGVSFLSGRPTVSHAGGSCGTWSDSLSVDVGMRAVVYGHGVVEDGDVDDSCRVVGCTEDHREAARAQVRMQRCSQGSSGRQQLGDAGAGVVETAWCTCMRVCVCADQDRKKPTSRCETATAMRRAMDEAFTDDR